MKTLFLISLLLTSSAALASPCASQIGNCDYYVCRDKLQPCGNDGYFLHFGNRYCTDFVNKVKPTVKPPEAEWLDRIESCLQTEAEKIPPTDSCSQIEDQAIDSHFECYTSNGFCKQSLELKAKIVETIYKELTHPKIIAVMKKILASCVSN